MAERLSPSITHDTAPGSDRAVPSGDVVLRIVGVVEYYGKIVEYSAVDPANEALAARVVIHKERPPIPTRPTDNQIRIGSRLTHMTDAEVRQTAEIAEEVAAYNEGDQGVLLYDEKPAIVHTLGQSEGAGLLGLTLWNIAMQDFKNAVPSANLSKDSAPIVNKARELGLLKPGDGRPAVATNAFDKKSGNLWADKAKESVVKARLDSGDNRILTEQDLQDSSAQLRAAIRDALAAKRRAATKPKITHHQDTLFEI